MRKTFVSTIAMGLMFLALIICHWSPGVREVFDAFCTAMVTTAGGYGIVNVLAKKQPPKVLKVKAKLEGPGQAPPV